MVGFLSQKLYYFLTDRYTHLTYFVDNSKKTPVKYLYYPTEFETMSANQIRKYKRGQTRRFLLWGIQNSDKMDDNDRKIWYTKCFNQVGISAVSIIVGMVLRRAFMKIDLPKLDIYLEDSIFTTNWVRKFLAYVSALAVFFVYQSAIPETYLMDIALYYSPNWGTHLHCKEIDPIFKDLFKQRFYLTNI